MNAPLLADPVQRCVDFVRGLGVRDAYELTHLVSNRATLDYLAFHYIDPIIDAYRSGLQRTEPIGTYWHGWRRIPLSLFIDIDSDAAIVALRGDRPGFGWAVYHGKTGARIGQENPWPRRLAAFRAGTAPWQRLTAALAALGAPDAIARVLGDPAAAEAFFQAYVRPTVRDYDARGRPHCADWVHWWNLLSVKLTWTNQTWRLELRRWYQKNWVAFGALTGNTQLVSHSFA